MTRTEAHEVIRKLSAKQREAIALFVETAETQGDYQFDGEGSVWMDDVNATLNQLAAEIRGA